MAIKRMLTWMHEEDRTVAYLARRTGVDPGRLINVMVDAEPTDAEVAALSAATGVPTEELMEAAADPSSTAAALDPLRCYTVAEAAALMGVSADTVRAEVKAGVLDCVVIGAQAHRIPRWALEQRLMTTQRVRDGPGSGLPMPTRDHEPNTVKETS